jgi:hypothetical protein
LKFWFIFQKSFKLFL